MRVDCCSWRPERVACAGAGASGGGPGSSGAASGAETPVADANLADEPDGTESSPLKAPAGYGMEPAGWKEGMVFWVPFSDKKADSMVVGSEGITYSLRGGTVEYHSKANLQGGALKVSMDVLQRWRDAENSAPASAFAGGTPDAPAPVRAAAISALDDAEGDLMEEDSDVGAPDPWDEPPDRDAPPTAYGDGGPWCEPPAEAACDQCGHGGRVL